ncbi:type III toxin-antitoxin system ToxN/AbiQ family toxin [Vibrio atlanticus]|uniref:Type III toxin-antitoxin system ToxN/AbiQ family toxin n=1 Tax=Vibrio atlanticus TaxID=693153 RepID=A0A1C3IVM1_9VIBR|nr:type III toxin-antitoxin system ToxN/AbiQ family toxin [Vibrio atlanticus]SBS65479.1 hypothetical protein VAT7223_02718 [Vibrio atlanticus]
MNFYTVTDDYINHLKKTDKTVPNNYSEKRAYVGIVLHVNGCKYLAPLTSYKEKQDRISSSSPSVYKINEDGVLSNKLGMLQLNNMIPVTDAVITELDVEKQDEPYRSMLQRQIKFIKKNGDKIIERAEKLHKLVVVDKHKHFSNISCDFSALEAAMGTYQVPTPKPPTLSQLAALLSKNTP